MKLLDKAIINGDIGYLVTLINEGVDCEGAVLIHLKDQLIPKHFTQKALEEKGVILEVEGLEAIIQQYIEKSRNDYRQETYIKRIYLTLQQALLAWQSGQMKNKTVEKDFNQRAVSILKDVWVKGELPESVRSNFKDKEKSHIANKFSQWKQNKMDAVESERVDEVVLYAVMQFWYVANDQNDVLIAALRQGMYEEAARALKAGQGEKGLLSGMHAFLRKQVINQIQEGVINSDENKLFRKIIEDEKNALLKGRVVSDVISVYEKAASALLEKWCDNQLEKNVEKVVMEYAVQNLRMYNLPGQAKTVFVGSGLKNLIKRYKDKQLSQKLISRLDQQFETNVMGYYESQLQKKSEYREEVGEVISKDMLSDWQHGKFNNHIDNAFKALFLRDLKKLITKLRQHVSGNGAYVSLINKLKKSKEKINSLEEKLKRLEVLVSERSKGNGLSSKSKEGLEHSTSEEKGYAPIFSKKTSTEKNMNQDQFDKSEEEIGREGCKYS